MPYDIYSQHASWLDDFFGGVLNNLGLYATTWRMKFLETWSHFETLGGTEGPSYNVLGTTMSEPGATANTGGQSDVWNFPDLPTAEKATSDTIANYQSVMDSLNSQQINPNAASDIGSSWGTSGFANLLASGWSPGPVDTEMPVIGMQPPPVATNTITPSAPPITTPVSTTPVSVVSTARNPTMANTLPITPAPVSSPAVAVKPPTYNYIPSVFNTFNPDTTVQNSGILSAGLNAGSWNVTSVLPGGVNTNDIQGYTAWQQQANGQWTQWNKGEFIAGGEKVGLLPIGMSLPGRNPR